MPDILKFVQVCKRNVPKRGKFRREWKDDRKYYEALDALLDQIFEIAEEEFGPEFTWGAFAAKAGLSAQTIVNLGERVTKRPQFRTVLYAAAAIDRGITLQVLHHKGKSKAKLRLARTG